MLLLVESAKLIFGYMNNKVSENKKLVLLIKRTKTKNNNKQEQTNKQTKENKLGYNYTLYINKITYIHEINVD